MADNPFKRPDESGFLDNDPFAELMRMADAPRPATQEPSRSANESFDIDLERELLGDFEEPDAGPAASSIADHWSREPEYERAAAEAESEPSIHEPSYVEPEFSGSGDEAALDEFDMAFDLDMSDEGPHLPLSAADTQVEQSVVFEAEDDVPEDFDVRSHALFQSVPEIADQPESAGDPVVTNPVADELDEAFADFDLADDLQSEIAAEPQLVADPISFDESDTELGQFSEPAPHHSEIWTSGVEVVSDDDLDLAFDAELEVAEDMAAEPVAATGDEWRFDEQTAHEDVAAEYDVQDEPFVGGSTHFAETDAAETAPTFAHDDVLQAGPAADHEQQTEYAQEPEASLAWTPLELQPEGPVESVAAHVEPQFSSPFEPQLRREIADDDDVLNDIESWLGADSEPAAQAAAAASVTTRPVFTAVDPAPVAPETSGPAAVESEALSLEDELSALLGDDVALQVPAREEAIDWHEPTPYEARDAQPVVTNAPPVESDEIEIALDFDFDEPDLEQEYAPQPTAWQETDEYGWDGGQEATAFEVETSDQDDFDAAAFSASRPSSDNLVEEPVAPKKSGPLALLAALAPAAIARFGGGERSSVARSTEAAQPATPLFGLARANRPVPPEIETVDVEDQPVALADDLDIPDLTESEDVAPLFSPDDLEAELDVAFGSLATEEELPAPQQKAASVQALEQPPLQGYFADGDYAYTPQEGAVGSEFGDVEFDDDADDEDFDARQSAPKDGMRRKYFILGGVAAVAIIGGLGYFVSGGPVGDGAPAIVRADPEPVRVRPENRGGATVPNQNSQAYRRATGATGEPGGGQEQLVTSVEEPMDVRAAVAPSEPMDDFPLVGMEEIPMLGEAEANEMLASVKSAERLGSVEDIIEEDSIEIAPRRVRTMVVRPDGTLVPRDEVPPAATRAELEATTVAAASGQGTAVPLVQDAQPIGTLVPQSEVLADDPVMPDTVGVVPSRPQPSAAPVGQPAPVQVAAAEAPAAQAPVAQSASAAPAVGEWSMQIASQPTAEGAQSAYQDLARRYGSVLEGKGVNIVRADIEGMGTFYRVRIPAATRDEAINLCESFKGAGGNCFVSR